MDWSCDVAIQQWEFFRGLTLVRGDKDGDVVLVVGSLQHKGLCLCHFWGLTERVTHICANVTERELGSHVC